MSWIILERDTLRPVMEIFNVMNSVNDDQYITIPLKAYKRLEKQK